MLQSADIDFIKKLIAQYKVSLKERGFDDELYKFKLIKKFSNQWNMNADDFGQMVRRIDFSNLVYPGSKGANVQMATQKPDKTRELFSLLYDESIPLEDRIPAFQKGVDALFEEVKTNPNHKAWPEERAIATYLAFRYPEKYFLYKDSFYKALCQLLGIKKASAGKKYLHYLSLANEIRDKCVLQDKELIEEAEEHLDNDCYPDPNRTVLTQDILYTTLVKVPNRKATADEDQESALLNKLQEIGNRKALEIYFENLQTLFTTVAVDEDDPQLYFTVRRKYKRITFTYGQRYIHYIERYYDRFVYGFIVSPQDASKYAGKHGFLEEEFGGSMKMHFIKVSLDQNDINSFDFTSLLQDCIKGFSLEKARDTDYSFREGANKESHNTLVYKMAVDEDYRNRILSKVDNTPSNTNTQIQPSVKFDFPVSAPKNTILYGPPGTGKTYSTIDLSVAIASKEQGSHHANKLRFDELRKQGQIEFITFHQNYAYEDFVVGMRPAESDGNLIFKKHEGVFYDLCKRAEANYLNYKTGTKQGNFDTDFGHFIKPLTEGSEIEVKLLSNEGSFHLYDINDTTIRFRKQSGSTIHSLSIGTLKELYNGTRELTSGLQYYYNAIIRDLKAGRTKQANEPLKNYVLIIDEINRANISKVFGELITLLEEDKRIDGENELKVTLPNGEKQFGIPPNLYIIGTMNTTAERILYRKKRYYKGGDDSSWNWLYRKPYYKPFGNCLVEIIKEHNQLVLQESIDLDELEHYLNAVWQNRHTLNNELDQEVLEQAKQQQFVSLLRGNVIKAGQYVGFLQYKQLNLCIYPKLFGELDKDNITLFYRHLLYWLSFCRRINFPFNHVAAESLIGNDFPEALIHLFAKRTLTLLQQYPYHQFEVIEEKLSQVKGRLLTQRYMNESVVKGNFHQLICEHEPLRFDNMLNRVIKFVTRQLIQRSKFKETWYYLEQILFVLEDVEDRQVTIVDCDRIKLNPMFTDYKECLEMCRFFLNNEHIQRLVGINNQFCFLLPMNYVFEDFICGFIENKFKDRYRTTYQSSNWLTDQRVFRMMNDIVLKDEKGDLLLIVDTKYKLRQRDNDAKKGISQSDLYQMLAYAIRQNCKKVLLLYPLSHGLAERPEVDVFTISSQMFNEPISIMAADIQICSMDTKRLDDIVYEQLDHFILKALN
jgi:5-methylcytosine-specific restriction enzyme subunit McrC